jgi:hypothetical protein
MASQPTEDGIGASKTPPTCRSQEAHPRAWVSQSPARLAGTAAPSNRPNHLHIGRVHFEVTRNTDRPGKFASCEPLAERRAHPIARIRQHTAKAHTGGDDTIRHLPDILSIAAEDMLADARWQNISWRTGKSPPGPSLASSVPFDIRSEHPARSNRARLLVQLSGRNNRSANMTGTSPRASVSDTSVWQLAVLPSAEAYCGATPTECAPFLGIAVSSITSTASLPPTSLSA